MVGTRPTVLGLSIRNALFASLLPMSMAFAANAMADEAKAEEKPMETIVVTASALKQSAPMAETAQSVDIIDRSEIEMRDIQKLDETFRYTAGFTSPYGADNDAEWMYIRGFEPSVLLDGNRLYKEGFFAWTVETFGLDRVELIKGASSVLYGDAMPGGLINAVQKKPTDMPQGNIHVAGGNKDYLELGADVSGWVNADGSQRYRLVAKVDQSEGELDGTESDRVYIAPSYTIDFSEDTSLTLLSTFLKDDGVPQNGFFPVYGSRFELPNGETIDPSTNYGEPDEDKFEKTQFSLGYQLRHYLNDTWTLKQNANYAHTDLDLYSSSAYGSAWDVNADPYTLNRYTLINDGTVESFTIDNNATAEWQNDKFENRFLVGVDYQNHVNDFKGNGLGVWVGTVDALNPTYGNVSDLTSSLYDNEITKNQVGVYSQFHTKWNDSWLANVGARYDWFDVENKGQFEDAIDDGQFSWNASLMYQADNGMSPYVSYSESFYVMSSLNWQTNKLYEPVESSQYEVGMKYTPEWMNGYINLAWFDLEQKAALTSALTDNGVLYQQQDEQNTQGIEIEAKVKATDNLSLTANYTYLDARSGANDSRTVMVPHNMASAWAHYDMAGLGIDGLTLGAGVRYTGASVDSVARSNSSDWSLVVDPLNYSVSSYTVWDAMASYAFSSKLSLQLNLNNLADKEYVVGCGSGTCYYGESRRISASLNYSW
ncbi:TonB-dependent siderophore receptor [Shewanella acanthi]|uniref:TonB-dependent siderophore receptor n=1 Tax=Shewanella acanthi TaxID=2864212 RepID=UPI001C65A6C7|nr:TonB-dependent siderophore receptor [Shewanella acanthi]QYJ78326.1 TonB-dependent siderophore receptor [Shewanella acanthi]